MDEFDFLLVENEDNDIKDNSVDLYSWCMKNGEYGQQILSEWSDRNKTHFGEVLSPHDVYDKDTRKYWWKCSMCGEEYYSQLYKRLYNHRECPHCAPKRWGRKQSENRAENGVSIRDYCPTVSYGSIILKEWDEQKNSAEGHTLDNTPFSSNKHSHWICSNCGKHYEKMVYSRVHLNQGCPDCGRAGTSFPEQFIYWALKQIDPNTKHRCKINDFEYDIFIPMGNLLIEYNGRYWHKDKAERDNEKRNNAIAQGYRFISIEESRNIQNDIYTMDRIILRETLVGYEKKLGTAIEYIIEMFLGRSYKIDFRVANEEAERHLFVPVNNSVDEMYPFLKEEFDVDKNIKSLDTLTCGSNKNIVWKCSKCKNNWTTMLNDRTIRKRGCPYCGFNIFDGKVHNRAIKKKKPLVLGQYNL
jgi:predicted  nucleic acid-binding Zn-ribbon protein